MFVRLGLAFLTYVTNVEVDVHMITVDGVNLHGFRRRLLHSVAFNEFFLMAAACVRRPFAQVLRNSISGHPPPTGCDMRTVSLQSLVDYHSSVLGNFAPFLDFAWKNCIVLQP